MITDAHGSHDSARLKKYLEVVDLKAADDRCTRC